MTAHKAVFFTLDEVNRLKIIQVGVDRYLSRYRESGPLGMANRRRGRPSNNQAARGYLEKHGKPLALYSDKASVFRINNKNATGGDGYTQFGRAMHELNIQAICANTSSAKGRVERAHLTLQDRLVKELRLRGISSVDAANEFADEFMADYDRRFAKAPRHDFDVHRPLETDDDLAAFFTWREPRPPCFKIPDGAV